MNAPTHPTREQLSAFLLGTMPTDETEGLVEHVETCVECEATLEELESVADSFVQELRQPPPVDEYAKEPDLQDAITKAVGFFGRTSPAQETETSVSDLGTLGEYQLQEKLGEGGMGAVYKAMHTKLDMEVALKVLPKGRLDDKGALARFEREMKAVGRLVHPNIVRALDAR